MLNRQYLLSKKVTWNNCLEIVRTFRVNESAARNRDEGKR